MPEKDVEAAEDEQRAATFEESKRELERRENAKSDQALEEKATDQLAEHNDQADHADSTDHDAQSTDDSASHKVDGDHHNDDDE